MPKMIKTPTIGQTGMPGFLLWARRESPVLYATLVREFPEVDDFDTALNAQGMSGIMDIVSGIGGALSSAASKIGTFVKNNALPIMAAAAPIIVAKKQADVAVAQIKLANAQQAPMQTALTTQGGYSVPIPVKPAGSLTPMQSAPVMQQVRSAVASVPSWAWIAGAGVAVLLAARALRR